MTAAGLASDREIAACYDESPYLSVAIPESHPARVASVARLMGLETAPVGSCRVLELGCAGGGNLVPMAIGMPSATFVGVDISPVQVSQANALAASCGASNVEFRAMSLAEITPDFGTFDYIVCHGVYSWVPDAARAALLRVCSENLAENGVAFVSYNVYPGWHFPGMIREMMMYHVRRIDDPPTKAKAARAFLDFLGANAPDKDAHHARMFRDEAQQLRNHADSYLLHEHLEDVNEPIYYHEFVDRVAEHGLKVLGDARFFSMAIAAQPRVAEVLDRVATNPLDREQYFDFLCNRRFRRSLLCHASARTALRADPRAVKSLAVMSLVKAAEPPADLTTTSPVRFLAADGSHRITASDPPTKVALTALFDAAPRALPFAELWELVRGRIAKSDPGVTADVLATRLLECYGGNGIDLLAHEPPVALRPGECPRAFPPARVSAGQGMSQPPNLRHTFVTLSEFDTLVIRQLDGRSDREAIVDALVAAISRGEFTIRQNGQPITDPALTRPLMERSLPPSLERLARGALLMT